MMRHATHRSADHRDATVQSRSPSPAQGEPAQRFFRCTILIAVALLLPAAIQALCNVFPDTLSPHHAAALISLALSAAIVATVRLIAALLHE